MKKILFICTEGFDTPGPSNHLIGTLIEDLLENEFQITLVQSRRQKVNFFYYLQKLAYKFSDVLTVISEDMKIKVVEQGAKEEKIYSIVNWFDDRSVHEVDWTENRFVNKYDLSKDKFYVQYAGTMGYVFDYKMVLNVAEKLRDYSDIEFHMIGQGSQKESFIKEAKEKALGMQDSYAQKQVTSHDVIREGLFFCYFSFVEWRIDCNNAYNGILC